MNLILQAIKSMFRGVKKDIKNLAQGLQDLKQDFELKYLPKDNELYVKTEDFDVADYKESRIKWDKAPQNLIYNKYMTFALDNITVGNSITQEESYPVPEDFRSKHNFTNHGTYRILLKFKATSDFCGDGTVATREIVCEMTHSRIVTTLGSYKGEIWRMGSVVIANKLFAVKYNVFNDGTDVYETVTLTRIV